MEIADGAPAPKRGDLLYTNIGGSRERTWLILRAVRMKTEKRRYALWRERWWQVEPDLRVRLYRSACRHGGQMTWVAKALPGKPKRRKSIHSF